MMDTIKLIEMFLKDSEIPCEVYLDDPYRMPHDSGPHRGLRHLFVFSTEDHPQWSPMVVTLSILTENGVVVGGPTVGDAPWDTIARLSEPNAFEKILTWVKAKTELHFRKTDEAVGNISANYEKRQTSQDSLP